MHTRLTELGSVCCRSRDAPASIALENLSMLGPPCTQFQHLPQRPRAIRHITVICANVAVTSYKTREIQRFRRLPHQLAWWTEAREGETYRHCPHLWKALWKEEIGEMRDAVELWDDCAALIRAQVSDVVWNTCLLYTSPSPRDS